MTMLVYSLALALGLTVSAPWWLFRMATTQRYRRGLPERLGRVPPALRDLARNHRILWLHAVSVGEVLAATRLVHELESALNSSHPAPTVSPLPTASAAEKPWRIVISTTTRTGQDLARKRFAKLPDGPARVFYFPLDFAFANRAWLCALQPAALLLMESELWPRLLHECSRAHVPVAVINARISDRTFNRTLRLRNLWQRMAQHVTLWLAQSKDDAFRLERLGANPAQIQTPGNLKFDINAPRNSAMPELIRRIASDRPVLVAGSTVEAGGINEEQFVIDAWKGKLRCSHRMLLVLAPRHPERFSKVLDLVSAFPSVRATDLLTFAVNGSTLPDADVIVLDTIGDLAAVYQVATVAFVGGSMVPKGGHNPLEPAQFGVPTVMGTSWQNFKDIVYDMRPGGAVFDLPCDDAHHLEGEIRNYLLQPEYLRSAGAQAKRVFEQKQGATTRAIEAILALLSLNPTSTLSSRPEAAHVAAGVERPAVVPSPTPKGHPQ